MLSARLWLDVRGTHEWNIDPCRFDLWHESGYEPEIWDTCTLKYSKKEWERIYSFGIEVGGKWVKKEYEARRPWCQMERGQWTYCDCSFCKLLFKISY